MVSVKNQVDLDTKNKKTWSYHSKISNFEKNEISNFTHVSVTFKVLFYIIIHIYILIIMQVLKDEDSRLLFVSAQNSTYK